MAVSNRTSKAFVDLRTSHSLDTIMSITNIVYCALPQIHTHTHTHTKDYSEGIYIVLIPPYRCRLGSSVTILNGANVEIVCVQLDYKKVVLTLCTQQSDRHYIITCTVYWKMGKEAEFN